MNRAALAVVAACSSGAPPPSAPSSAPRAIPDAAVARRSAVDLPPEVHVHPPGSANDDFPHTRDRLAPLLAGAKTCIPTADGVEVALDTFDGHLVACAQVMTRRDVTVFFDPVWYACWNVAPATAKLERRLDLARNYFECRDGKCPPGDDPDHAVSYDGKTHVRFDPEAMTIAIAPRASDGTIGATTRTFAAPTELAGAMLVRGWLVSVGHAIFARGDAGFVVFDDTGKPLGHAAGLVARVLDDGHVLVADDGRPPVDDDDAAAKPEPLHAVVFDLARGKTTTVTLPDPAAVEATYFGGKAYAVAGRTLLELDAASFAVKAHRTLAACP